MITPQVAQMLKANAGNPRVLRRMMMENQLTEADVGQALGFKPEQMAAYLGKPQAPQAPDAQAPQPMGGTPMPKPPMPEQAATPMPKPPMPAPAVNDAPAMPSTVTEHPMPKPMPATTMPKPGMKPGMPEDELRAAVQEIAASFGKPGKKPSAQDSEELERGFTRERGVKL